MDRKEKFKRENERKRNSVEGFDVSNKKAPVTNNLWERALLFGFGISIFLHSTYPSQWPYINIIHIQSERERERVYFGAFLPFLHLINYTVHSISAGHNVVVVVYIYFL